VTVEADGEFAIFNRDRVNTMASARRTSSEARAKAAERAEELEEQETTDGVDEDAG
jgi:hypothetical protein